MPGTEKPLTSFRWGFFSRCFLGNTNSNLQILHTFGEIRLHKLRESHNNCLLITFHSVYSKPYAFVRIYEHRAEPIFLAYMALFQGYVAAWKSTSPSLPPRLTHTCEHAHAQEQSFTEVLNSFSHKASLWFPIRYKIMAIFNYISQPVNPTQPTHFQLLEQRACKWTTNHDAVTCSEPRNKVQRRLLALSTDPITNSECFFADWDKVVLLSPNINFCNNTTKCMMHYGQEQNTLLANTSGKKLHLKNEVLGKLNELAHK